jgi:hypothetical protein
MILVLKNQSFTNKRPTFSRSFAIEFRVTQFTPRGGIQYVNLEMTGFA